MCLKVLSHTDRSFEQKNGQQALAFLMDENYLKSSMCIHLFGRLYRVTRIALRTIEEQVQ
jgi:hypothetical protein